MSKVPVAEPPGDPAPSTTPADVAVTASVVVPLMGTGVTRAGWSDSSSAAPASTVKYQLPCDGKPSSAHARKDTV